MNIFSILIYVCPVVGGILFLVGKAIEDSAIDDMKGCIGVWLKLLGGAIAIGGTVLSIAGAMASSR